MSTHKNADQPPELSLPLICCSVSYHLGCQQHLKGKILALFSIFIRTCFFHSQTNILQTKVPGPHVFL